MLKQTTVAMGVSLMLSGCISMGPDAICPPDSAINLADAEVQAKPNKDVKVIVLPVSMDFDDAAQNRMQSVIRHTLENQIVETGTQLVDRKLANSLKNEIKLAEQSGRYNTSGVPIADYAVLTDITSADFSTSFSEASSYTNKKGETTYTPASCHYNFDVVATIKIVSLPDMALLKRIEIKGDNSASTEMNNSRCPISEGGYKSLASKAAEEAVKYNSELRTMMAAKAPVLEVRQCKEGIMAKVAMGSEKNVQPKDTIAFSKILKNSDGELETFAVGEGTVVNIPTHGIKPEYSWVGIDEETSLKLRKGDLATIVPAQCSNLLDFKCHMKNIGL